jgi:hypothetical protein
MEHKKRMDAQKEIPTWHEERGGGGTVENKTRTYKRTDKKKELTKGGRVGLEKIK